MSTLSHYLMIAVTSITLTIFCGLSLLPHEVRMMDSELRLSSPMPKLPSSLDQFSQFTKEFDAYLNDNVPMRSQLVSLRNLARLKFFNETQSTFVIAGQDGWLYLGGTSINYFRNSYPYTDESLSTWVAMLEKRKTWLKDRGIDYLLVIAPNKSTAYPEFYPKKYNKVRPDSRCDQLLEKVGGSDYILDLRPAIAREREKSKDLLYFKTDTHWNDLGALAGAREIVDRLKKRSDLFEKATIPEVQFQTEEYSGDLARMLDLEGILSESTRAVKVVNPKARTIRDETSTSNTTSAGGKRILVSRTGDESLPKALFLRDSFTTAIQPYLSECFSESVYFWQHDLSSKLIDAHKPDIVVEILCERLLMDKEPENEL
ncbi:MAG: hypothetical protein KC777_04235 [Cyanobacteria bacterium HKST-UBA02]|nr:hypothetical protein [Cyanobacteria bacterium HKST-UBA02]